MSILAHIIRDASSAAATQYPRPNRPRSRCWPSAGSASTFPIPHPLFPIPCLFVRTLTKSWPSLHFVRTLTTFRPLRPPVRPAILALVTYVNFAPSKTPQKRNKTEQKRTKTDKNGHINRKNGTKTSAFCLTYLNIRPPNRPSRPRNKVQAQKKRAFARFGEVKIDVSLIEQAACKPTRLCPRGRPAATCPRFTPAQAAAHTCRWRISDSGFQIAASRGGLRSALPDVYTMCPGTVRPRHPGPYGPWLDREPTGF